MEKGGGWKTSRMTPLPKRGLDPPRTVRFPPPSGVSALFFLYKNPRQSRPEPLLEGSKNYRESAFSGTFSSPHTFCTPPYHGPTLLTERFQPRAESPKISSRGPQKSLVDVSDIFFPLRRGEGGVRGASKGRGSVPLLKIPGPCPSFPCFFGIPCFFTLRGIPCFFERFSLLFQGF